MKYLTLLALGVVSLVPRAFAIYAPIPEPEAPGDPISFTVRGSITSDSNIFGAQTSEIDSMVVSVSPKAAVNMSLTDQTFFSAHYQLTLEHMDKRPGDKTLDSHQLMARIAHQFNESMTLDINDVFSAQRNPESLLAGVPLNTDQSSKNNEFNVVFTAPVGPRINLTLKGRSGLFRFDSARLSASLDRAENLLGVMADHEFLPELKLSAEYRYQVINYRTDGSLKDKTSHFLMAGADYMLDEQVSASLRIGAEDRNRDGESGATSPYVELSAKYDYAEGSFLSGGYTMTYQEASNVNLYTDTQVNRLFANLQHAVTPLVTASASITFEPSRLKGRTTTTATLPLPPAGSAITLPAAPVPTVNEDTWRFGVALTWKALQQLSVSATYDHDEVISDDASREMNRDRFGIMGIVQF